MGNFDRGSRSGGRSFGGNRSFGGRNDRRGGFGGSRSGGERRSFDGDRPMHKAVCSNCGRECEVPFRPTNTKPVYCSDCFEKMGNDRGTSSARPSFNSQRPDQSKSQFEAINAKLERILKLLEPQKKVEIAVAPLEKETKEVAAPKVKKEPKKVISKKKE